MTDRTKEVIKGLEQFIADFKPFCGNKSDWQRVYDALALLKKLEPEYPIRKQGKHGVFSYCPKCETILNDMARPKYCDRCGQAVKWL